MKNTVLYTAWCVLYCLCAALGFLPERSGAVQALLTVLSLLFFVPPGLLVFRAGREQNKKILSLVRTVSITSLGLTLTALIFNIIFAAKSTAVGNFLHGLLILVSAPMLSMGYWALSLFLWACLLMATLRRR